MGFCIDLDGVDYVMSGTDTKKLTLKIGAMDLALTEAQIKTHLDNNDPKAGDKISGADLAKAFAKQYTAAGGTSIETVAGKGNK